MIVCGFSQQCKQLLVALFWGEVPKPAITVSQPLLSSKIPVRRPLSWELSFTLFYCNRTQAGLFYPCLYCFVSLWVFICLCLETGSWFVLKTRLKLWLILSRTLRGWDCRHSPLCQVYSFIYFFNLINAAAIFTHKEGLRRDAMLRPFR